MLTLGLVVELHHFVFLALIAPEVGIFVEVDDMTISGASASSRATISATATSDAESAMNTLVSHAFIDLFVRTHVFQTPISALFCDSWYGRAVPLSLVLRGLACGPSRQLYLAAKQMPQEEYLHRLRRRTTKAIVEHNMLPNDTG